MTLHDLTTARLTHVDSRLQETLKTSIVEVNRDDFKAQVPRLTSKLASLLRAAQIAFAQSDVAARLAETGDKPVDAAMALAPEVLAIPEMRAFFDAARQPEMMRSSSELSTPTILPQSILVPFYFILDVAEAGVVPFAGFAFDLTSDDGNVNFYAGLNVLVGEDITVAAGYGIGLTAMSYNHMTGASVGLSADFVKGEGYYIEGSVGWSLLPPYAKISQWAIVVGDATGVGGGGDAFGGFTISLFDMSMPPMVQPDGPNIIDVRKFDAIQTKNDNGSDSLHFDVKFSDEDNNDYEFRYPMWDHRDVQKGDIWEVGYTVKFWDTVTIELKTGGGKLAEWTIDASELTAGEMYHPANVTKGSSDQKLDYALYVYPHHLGG
ncbi:hypothetical protein [Planktotalea sp.]|uniref:hypothetical protein n=1 Tax=Planktotalea sp. TaxID=2029877 RepID=UPI003299547F